MVGLWLCFTQIIRLPWNTLKHSIFLRIYRILVDIFRDKNIWRFPHIWDDFFFAGTWPSTGIHHEISSCLRPTRPLRVSLYRARSRSRNSERRRRPFISPPREQKAFIYDNGHDKHRCVYIYIYVYMYILCLSIYLSIYLYIYIFILAPPGTMYIYIYIYIYIQIHTCI